MDAELKAEMLEIEARFWGSMQRKDPATAAAMTAPECVVVGAQGVSKIDPSKMAQLLDGAQWDIDEYSFDGATTQVVRLSDDIAVVAYKVKERLTVDGANVEFEANDASVWVRQDGKWRCALHTESLAGDPFGRDRVAEAGMAMGTT